MFSHPLVRTRIGISLFFFLLFIRSVAPRPHPSPPLNYNNDFFIFKKKINKKFTRNMS